MNEGSIKITQMTPEYLAKRREEEKVLFPGSLYGSPPSLDRSLLTEFETALHAGSEEAIQRFLSANPYALHYAIPSSGHHGVWAFPKRMIRAQRIDGTPGLIPDFLVVSANSLGYTWHIIELKRWDTQFANIKGNSLSQSGIKAIVQCATYVAHFNDYIETVRSNIGVQEVIQPENVIVIIGDSTTETNAQKIRRDEFQKLAPRMEIITYDRLRRGLANDLRPRDG
jgi:hypothetical protein